MGAGGGGGGGGGWRGKGEGVGGFRQLIFIASLLPAHRPLTDWRHQAKILAAWVGVKMFLRHERFGEYVHNHASRLFFYSSSSVSKSEASNLTRPLSCEPVLVFIPAMLATRIPQHGAIHFNYKTQQPALTATRLC